MNRQTKNLIHNILYICVIAVLMSFAFSASKCHATEILFHLSSKHGEEFYYDKSTNEQKDYNSINRGVGVSYPIINYMDVRAGFYKNSYFNNSGYIGVFPHLDIFKGLKAGVQMGYVSGYTGYSSPLLLLPTISYTFKNVVSEIGYIPSINNDTISLLTFTTGIKF